jgi:hypothetical protein
MVVTYEGISKRNFHRRTGTRDNGGSSVTLVKEITDIIAFWKYGGVLVA